MTPNTKLRATAVVTTVLLDLQDRPGFGDLLDDLGYEEQQEIEEELEAKVCQALEHFEGLPG